MIILQFDELRMYWSQICFLILLIPVSLSFRTLRIIENEVDCDLPCIQNEFERVIQSERSVYLPSLLEKFFGKRVPTKLNRLLTFMGVEDGLDQFWNDVSTELSPNKMQLRVIGHVDNSVGEKFNVRSSRENNGRVRVENIYTLEEQGYVGIGVGVMFSNQEGSAPNIQVNDAINALSMGAIKLPTFLGFLSNWPMFELGILGDTRTHIENNPKLVEYSAKNIGFKQVSQMQRLMDSIDGFNDQLNSIKLVGKVKLPFNFPPFFESDDSDPRQTIEQNTFRPFNCSMMRRGPSRKMCKRAVRLARLKINHVLTEEADWEPTIDMEIDTGFGDTGISNFVNSMSNGKSLSLGIEDFNLGENTRVAEPKFKVAWAPASKNPLQFGILGYVTRKMFGETFNFITELMIPVTGAIGVTLFSPGVNRLMWPLPIWLGNLRGNGQMLQGILPLAGMLGGDMNIGFPPKEIELEDGSVISEDTRLKGSTTVSLDPASLTKTFVYSKLSPITIQTLINLWVGHKRYSLPPWIGDSGLKGLTERFGRVQKKKLWTEDGEEHTVLHAPKIPENPEQFIMTFAPLGLAAQALPDIDGTSIIQPGLTVLGRSGLLGVAAKTFGRIDFSHLGSDLDMALDPVNLGNGLVRLTAANVTTKRDIPEFMENVGPRVYSSFQAIPSRFRPLSTIPEFRISAGVDIFGIRFGIDVGVSLYGFHFKTELDVWGWFIARCLIQVKSSSKGFRNGVRVYGELTINSLKKLARGFYKDVIQAIGKLFQIPRMYRALKDWRRVKNAKRNFRLWRRDGRRRRRFFKGMSKFRESLSRAGGKLKPITNIQLISVKFDLNNASPDRSLPVFTEFKFTLFGKHILRYKRAKQVFHFGKPLNLFQIEDLANDIVMDIEDCLEDCAFDDDDCIRRVAECQSRQYAKSPLRDRPKAFIDRDERKIFFLSPENFADRDAVVEPIEPMPPMEAWTEPSEEEEDEITIESQDVMLENEVEDPYDDGYEFIDRDFDQRFAGKFLDRDFIISDDDDSSSVSSTLTDDDSFVTAVSHLEEDEGSDEGYESAISDARTTYSF